MVVCSGDLTQGRESRVVGDHQRYPGSFVPCTVSQCGVSGSAGSEQPQWLRKIVDTNHVCLSVCLSVRSAVCLSICTAVCVHLIRFWLCRCGDVIELINTGSPDWWKVGGGGEGGREK